MYYSSLLECQCSLNTNWTFKCSLFMLLLLLFLIDNHHFNVKAYQPQWWHTWSNATIETICGSLHSIERSIVTFSNSFLQWQFLNFLFFFLFSKKPSWFLYYSKSVKHFTDKIIEYISNLNCGFALFPKTKLRGNWTSSNFETLTRLQTWSWIHLLILFMEKQWRLPQTTFP